MKQSELIEEIASHHRNTGVSKTAIKFVLDALADQVHKTLKNDGEVTLPGIGKFSVSHRAERNGRNPATGASIKIEAKKAPKFTPAKALKDAVA